MVGVGKVEFRAGSLLDISAGRGRVLHFTFSLQTNGTGLFFETNFLFGLTSFEDRHLYKLIALKCMIILLLGCNQTTPIKERSGDDHSGELREAERHGLILFNAMQSPDASDAPNSKEQDLLDMASEQLLCEGNYSVVRVDDTGDNLEHIYLILQPPKSEGIQMGRHVRFDFALGTNDIKDIVTSSKSCLMIPVGDKDAEAAFVTHLLSDTRSEFHVYLSLYHQKPIYVGTDAGTWKVDDGKISKVK